jgi:hypothetical protein
MRHPSAAALRDAGSVATGDARPEVIVAACNVSYDVFDVLSFGEFRLQLAKCIESPKGIAWACGMRRFAVQFI